MEIQFVFGAFWDNVSQSNDLKANRKKQKVIATVTRILKLKYLNIEILN